MPAPSSASVAGAVPSVITREVLVSLFHILAAITTALRLLHRFRVRRLWWDDFWALCALLGAMVTFVLFWVRIMNGGKRGIIMMFTLMFYVISLWSARISVAVTLVRLLNDGPFRIGAKAVSVAFAVGATVLVILRVLNCGTKFDKPPLCKTPTYVAYLELILDLVGDTWLIAAPLVMLYRTNLSTKHRQLIAWVFACGILTAIASVLHIAFLMTNQDKMAGLTGHIQLGVSIVVCNLLVLVTYAYRKLQPSSEHSTRHTDSSAAATTAPGTRPPESSPGPAEYTSNLHLTELGSSMLGGSSRDMNSSALRVSDSFKDSAQSGGAYGSLTHSNTNRASSQSHGM